MENNQNIDIQTAIQNLSNVSGVAPEVIMSLLENTDNNVIISKYTGKILHIELEYLYVKTVEYMQNNIYKLSGTAIRIENKGDNFIIMSNNNVFKLLPITSFVTDELEELTKEEFIDYVNSQDLSFVNAEELYNTFVK